MKPTPPVPAWGEHTSIQNRRRNIIEKLNAPAYTLPSAARTPRLALDDIVELPSVTNLSRNFANGKCGLSFSLQRSKLLKRLTKLFLAVQYSNEQYVFLLETDFLLVVSVSSMVQKERNGFTRLALI